MLARVGEGGDHVTSLLTSHKKAQAKLLSHDQTNLPIRMRCWHKSGREVITWPNQLTNQNEVLARVREGGDHVTKPTYQSEWGAGTSRGWRWSRDSPVSHQPPPWGQFSVSRLAAPAWISEEVIYFSRWVKNLGLAKGGAGWGMRVILPIKACESFNDGFYVILIIKYSIK